MLPNITVCPEIKIKLRQKIIPPNLQRCTGAVSTKVIRIYEELNGSLGQRFFLRDLIKGDGGIDDKKRTLPKLNEGGNAL
jgi:hypothetical protein